MLYRFKSAATGDLVMAGEHADPLLRLFGKAAAAQGIVTVAELPAAVRAVDEFMNGADAAAGADASDADAVSSRQRAWPLLQLFKSALAARVPVVWGV